MAIQEGDKLPEATLHTMQEGRPAAVSTADLFGGKKVVLFALPGAFTPTCSAAHLPGYVVGSDDLFARGVDRIICLSVNDAHVMDAWGKAHNVEDRIMMIADGSIRFTRAIGMEVDLPGMGIRSRRYAMIVNDGVVEVLNLEEPRQFEVSDAQTMLAAL